jgi:SAM-dependent methyltransferase
MSRTQILEHFAKTRVQSLLTFRGLCNALKALGIAAAVRTLREHRKGRMSVCDIGCGKGGDVGKWMPHRPKKLIGVDGSGACIEEARSRHASMVSSGRGSMQALFLAQDLCASGMSLPSTDESIDIVCSHFFLQFAACDQVSLESLVAESFRCLAPGGVFMCLVPDGDRIFSLLRGSGERQRFGHFQLRKCQGVRYGLDASAFGLAYAFALSDEECTEYILFPAVLERLLRDRGFVAALPDAKFSASAQSFFLSQPDESAIVAGITRGQSCSHTDWLTLGFFRVFLARKAPGSPEEAEAAPRPRGRGRKRKTAAPVTPSGGVAAGVEASPTSIAGDAPV